jgi:hypothetical protein
MRRLVGALGLLGLICAAALPASAQSQFNVFGRNYNIAGTAGPGQFRLFGQLYNVVAQRSEVIFGRTYVWNAFGPQLRSGTFKNGVTIHLDDGTASGINNYAGVYFSQGTSIANDRLWFAARIAGGTGDQLYYLEGSDANGLFSTAASNAFSMFGGNVGTNQGGRCVSAMELNRTNTGVKLDRNVVACLFQDDDSIRLYDLDSMKTDSHADALYTQVKPGNTGTVGDAGSIIDPNLPFGTEPSFAPLPTQDGHTILVASGPANAANNALGTVTGIGIWDTATNKALPVLTDITTQTRAAAKPFPSTDSAGGALNCIKVALYDASTSEYWFLLSSPEPGGGQGTTPRTGLILVRANVTVPTNLATAKAGDIKVTVLDTQDMLKTAADILFPSTGAGMTGIAVGRAVTAGGPHIIYTTDYDGDMFTLIPVPG